VLKKIQLTSSSASGLRDLQEVFQSPSRVSFDFVVLGCCSAVRFRGLSKKETDRVAAARRVSLLLGLLRLGFEHSSVALRSFAINKMAYGWVSRLPTVVVSWGQWAVVRFSQGIFSAANKFLRAMMFGGLLHPDCVIGVTLLRLVFKARLGGGECGVIILAAVPCSVTLWDGSKKLMFNSFGLGFGLRVILKPKLI